MAIRQRGTSWQVDVRFPTGERRRRDVATEAAAQELHAAWLREAQEAQQERRAALDRGEAPPSPLAFRAAAEATFRDRWARRKAHHEMRRMVELLCHLIGDATPVHRIGATTVRSLRDECLNRRNNSPATWNRWASTLRPILVLAKREGAYTGALPEMDRLKETGMRTRVLEPEEEQALLAAFDALGPYYRDHKEAWLCILDAGLRNSEVWRLQGSHVSLKGNELRLVHTKNDKPRSVPMTDRLREVIARRLETHGLGPLFPGLDNSKLYRAFVKAKERAGLGHDKELVPYTGRHTCGTIVAETAGAFAAQAMLGHTNVGTTQKYVHLRSRALHAPNILGALNRRSSS